MKSKAQEFIDRLEEKKIQLEKDLNPPRTTLGQRLWRRFKGQCIYCKSNKGFYEEYIIAGMFDIRCKNCNHINESTLS